MENDKFAVKFDIPLDYVMGYLRYGHKEGIIELTKEELEELKKNPLDFVDKNDILSDLELVIDDYRAEDYGSPVEVNYEVIDGE